MVEPQPCRVINGHDIEIGKIFRQGIQLFIGRSVRITVFQHGDNIVHGGDIGGEGADVFIDLLTLTCNRRKRVILKERSSRQMDTAIKLKNNWLSRDSFRNFCIMKRGPP